MGLFKAKTKPPRSVPDILSAFNDIVAELKLTIDYEVTQASTERAEAEALLAIAVQRENDVARAYTVIGNIDSLMATPPDPEPEAPENTA